MSGLSPRPRLEYQGHQPEGGPHAEQVSQGGLDRSDHRHETSIRKLSPSMKAKTAVDWKSAPFAVMPPTTTPASTPSDAAGMYPSRIVGTTPMTSCPRGSPRNHDGQQGQVPGGTHFRLPRCRRRGGRPTVCFADNGIEETFDMPRGLAFHTVRLMVTRNLRSASSNTPLLASPPSASGSPGCAR